MDGLVYNLCYLVDNFLETYRIMDSGLFYILIMMPIWSITVVAGIMLHDDC